MDEGYIKFHCAWEQTDPLSHEMIHELNDWRNRLYKAGLIGIYPNGIGYGNVSARVYNSQQQFVITGTQTGGIARLDHSYYTLVTAYSLEENRVHCQGPLRASSESMTHAVFYETDPSIQAVVHGHHKQLWQRFLHKVPTTGKNVPYGTPDMAKEVQRLFGETKLSEEKIMAMAGHEEGIVAFGKSQQEAAELLLSML